MFPSDIFESEVEADHPATVTKLANIGKKSKPLSRIRYFGWWANRKRGCLLQLCRVRLDQTPEPAAITSDQTTVQQCPKCHRPMRIIERFSVEEIQNKERSLLLVIDTC